jgi:hypothetical protein
LVALIWNKMNGCENVKGVERTWRFFSLTPSILRTLAVLVGTAISGTLVGRFHLDGMEEVRMWTGQYKGE